MSLVFDPDQVSIRKLMPPSIVLMGPTSDNHVVFRKAFYVIHSSMAKIFLDT